MEPLGQRVRRLRVVRGMGKREVADFAGKSIRWLYDVEHDLTGLDRDEAEKLAVGFRVEVPVVLGLAPLPPSLAAAGMEPVRLAIRPELAAIADMVEGLADAAGLPPAEVYAKVDARLSRPVTGSGATATRQQLATGLVDYYGERALARAGLRPYAVRIDGQRLNLSIATRDAWHRCAVPLVNPNSPADDHGERCALVSAPRPAVPYGSPGVLARAIERLAAAALGAGPLMVNKPLYRLVDIELDRESLTADFALDSFANYALSYDLLASELIDSLVGPRRRPRLPLRDRLLGTADVLADISGRLCTGGLGCLFAMARPAARGHPADFLFVLQQRSRRVLNVPGSLSVIPRAFHQHLVDAADEVAIGVTVARELEEELFGRVDVDEGAGRANLALNPYHAAQQPEPMRWLTERGAYAAECTGFGLNLATGEFWFTCLAVVADEEFWATHGGSCLPNWEAAEVQTYSTADPDRLRELITDERWTSEGLFALLEGLRRLADRFPERVALPHLEVLPA